MAIDERKRAELIASTDLAELSDEQIEELRESARSLVALLDGDPPMMREAHSRLLEMMRMLRPLTGEDIQRLSREVSREDGDDPPATKH